MGTGITVEEAVLVSWVALANRYFAETRCLSALLVTVWAKLNFRRAITSGSGAVIKFCWAIPFFSRVLINSSRAVLQFSRVLLFSSRAILNFNRATLNSCRAVLKLCRGMLIFCRGALFSTGYAKLTCPHAIAGQKTPLWALVGRAVLCPPNAWPNRSSNEPPHAARTEWRALPIPNFYFPPNC